ncbi:hypothetical protein HMPREF1570_2616 [Klebsiella oxytoca KA-2]|nr:hypothetical protein HMPREF1570_2616 [Klebsiella oxytoca KA-2]EUC89007.1 hypothetical protein HMPREF1569_2947 [Klebsiella oxytoca OK-1]
MQNDTYIETNDQYKIFNCYRLSINIKSIAETDPFSNSSDISI